ncbi:MAG: YncE family protein [Ginsengibacter sp.]
MRKFPLIFTLLFFTFFSAFCQLNYRIDVLPVSGEGGWDYVAVNNGKIFASHGTQVNILNENNGDSIGFLAGTIGVHGMAFYNKKNKIYTSNGRLNNVFVFNGTTYQKIKEIPTGLNPDAIFFEPFSKKIITCNGSSNSLSIIDPEKDQLINTILLDGKPETAVSDGSGKVYVNIEDKNEMAVVDMKVMRVTTYWPIKPGEGASGLAINTKTHRLFAGCDNELLIVMNSQNGKVIASLPIGKGCDGVVYDKEKGLIFSSNGEGNITVIQESSANNYKVLETIKTSPSARTIAIDEHSQQLFLPAAKVETEIDTVTRRPHRKIIAGSFKILKIALK